MSAADFTVLVSSLMTTAPPTPVGLGLLWCLLQYNGEVRGRSSQHKHSQDVHGFPTETPLGGTEHPHKIHTHVEPSAAMLSEPDPSDSTRADPPPSPPLVMRLLP